MQDPGSDYKKTRIPALWYFYV